MAAMTSSSFRLRTALAGSALVLAALGSGPLGAQDLRDIPQKTNTSVNAPAPQPKTPSRQGREVQGPPAPLETQLRDTPPDEPVFRAPAPAPQQQAPVAPTVTRTAPGSGTAATPPAQTQRAAPARTSAPLQQSQPRGTAPGATPTTSPTATAPVAGNAVTSGEGAALPASPTGVATAPSPASDLTSFPTSATDGAAVTDSGATDTLAPPAPDNTPVMPWALGAAAILGLGGLAYMVTRRRKGVPAASAAGYGGIELGQTPFADELSESEAAAPITNALKTPKPKAPPEPAMVAPAPVAQSAPPEPVKPTADGRIVSRIRAPAPSAHIPAAPQAAQTPRAAEPPQPVKPASDGRIVSRLKVSDIVEEPAPPPPPQRRSPPPPSVNTVSVGYSVNTRG